MNWRYLIPCCGIIGGAVTGWLMRPEPTAIVFQQTRRRAAANLPADSVSVLNAGKAAIVDLAEVQALWGEDGALGIYNLLEGVPAASLAAWLEEYLPPESYGNTLRNGKRNGIREALVDRLAERDPLALAAWLNKIQPGHTSSTWLKNAVPGLLRDGSPEAVAALTRLRKDHGYVQTLELEWLAKRDPAAALQKFADSPVDFMPLEMAAWLIADSARALTFVNAHPDKSFAVLAEIGKQGSAALNDFAARLTDPVALKFAARLQLQGAARDGDAATFATLLARTGRDEHDGLQDDAVLNFARLHPGSAEAVARQFSDRPELCRLMIEQLAATHPARAAALMAEPLASGFLKNLPALIRIMRQMSNAWSLEDPSAAQTWLRDLPEEQRASVLPQAGDIATGYSNDDWLALTRGLPVDHRQTYQLAQQAMSRTKDPAVLAEWCASFPDQSRQHLLVRMRSEWKDPAALAAFEQRFNQALTIPPP